MPSFVSAAACSLLRRLVERPLLPAVTVKNRPIAEVRFAKVGSVKPSFTVDKTKRDSMVSWKVDAVESKQGAVSYWVCPNFWNVKRY